MANAEVWTVGRLLQWTTEYFRQHGSSSPRLEAELLLAEAIGCTRIELYTSFDQVASEQVRARFRELVRRRAAGEPVAYLLGRKEFYSLRFHVTPDVLIPRPETELLVVALLDLAKSVAAAGPLSICDVGTGSGVLAICAAKFLPTARIWAVDQSPKALDVARLNCQEHGVADRVQLVKGDLLDWAPPELRFHFILSNPPYVSEAEWEQLAPEIRDYEPRDALVAGPTGTEVIARLATQAAKHLHPGGWLLVEISPMIHEQVQKIFQQDSRWLLSPTLLDQARLPRVIQAQRR
ncbi:MAG: peptide chain release factor N(5)-glutamine methyltransferase [Thermoguttaceae bacterium]|nr:peptide chain release factor N(5)-glutamine methyltransferase [Thermoguttaceae bacterium]MDW8038379.1 peptide chain release factor N(5)-glutamine methyltransferase [Thermoguttaceae bacterium]